MALVEFPNKIGIPLWPFMVGYSEGPVGRNSTVGDAAGESTAFIGRLYLSTGVGTSKVFSTSATINFIVTVTTFVNVGSTWRVGIQDVTSGLEDGTFDVSKDLVGGTDTLTNDVLSTFTFTAGSKTITHGDLIAVVFECISRGGADVVRPQRIDNSNFPYCTTDTGAGPVKAATGPLVLLTSDDGTIGHFGEIFIANVVTNISHNSGSTPDEYALLFQVPFKCATNQLLAFLGEIDAGETGDLILYSAPLGTPVAERTVAVVPDETAVASSVVGLITLAITEFIFAINTDYAIAYRPTSTGNRLLGRVTIPSTLGGLSLGSNLRQGSRTDQTGAFAATTTIIPALGCMVNKFDTGVDPVGRSLVIARGTPY